MNCGKKNKDYTCNLKKNHKGLHKEYWGDTPIHTWINKEAIK